MSLTCTHKKRTSEKMSIYIKLGYWKESYVLKPIGRSGNFLCSIIYMTPSERFSPEILLHGFAHKVTTPTVLWIKMWKVFVKMEISDGVIPELMQWQIPRQCKFSREGDLRLERESGEVPHWEMGMEEKSETGLRSLGNWGWGEGLDWMGNKERRDNRGRDRQRVRVWEETLDKLANPKFCQELSLNT